MDKDDISKEGKSIKSIGIEILKKAEDLVHPGARQGMCPFHQGGATSKEGSSCPYLRLSQGMED